jgi:hypothetical protein
MKVPPTTVIIFANLPSLVFPGKNKVGYFLDRPRTNNTIEEEIKERVSAGNKAYFAHKMLFMSTTLSKKFKLKLHNSVIRPIVTHASETWVLKKRIEEKLLVFERKII